ncbi:hypothetical protein Tco_0872157 [Tanacetum coccineum]
MGGIFSIKEKDMDTKLLSAPESNNTLARCWFRRNVPVTTFGSWHDKLLKLVVGCFQWLALCFYSSCWGGSTSPEVVVVEGSSIIKLSFVIIGSLDIIVLCYPIHQALSHGFSGTGSFLSGFSMIHNELTNSAKIDSSGSLRFQNFYAQHLDVI